MAFPSNTATVTIHIPISLLKPKPGKTYDNSNKVEIETSIYAVSKLNVRGINNT